MGGLFPSLSLRRSGIMNSVLHPCLPSGTGLVYSALQAPSRPSARLLAPPSFSNRSAFSHAPQRWHGISIRIRIQPSLHMCNANDQANDRKGDTLQVESLLAVFNVGLDFFYTNFLPSSFIDKRKKELAILSAIFLGLVPWMQVSCGRDLFLSLKMQNITAAAVLGLATHCVFLLWTFLGIRTLHTRVRESKDPHQQKSNAWAIILTASQKTLPIAIAVIGSLAGSMGESGLLVLPCLITHITQIIFDSFLVRLWIQGDLQKSLGTIQ